MPKTYHVTIPDSIQVRDMSGEVNGHHFTTLVDNATNRLLLNINNTMLSVTSDGSLPPLPNPLPAGWYSVDQITLNIRATPSTAATIIGTFSSGNKLELTGQYHTDSRYHWGKLKDREGWVAGYDKSASDAYLLPTTPPSQTPPPDNSTANIKTVSVGGKYRLSLKGTSRTVEGYVNMRSLAFCGLPRVNGTAQSDIGRHLDAARGLGVRMVRFYGACVDLNSQQCADRILFTLDEMGKRGMLGLLTLNDSLASGFHVPGDEQWRNYEHGHLTYQYYEGEFYRQRYAAHLTTVLDRVGRHPALGAVDISNENAGYGRPDYAILPEDTANLLDYGKYAMSEIRERTIQKICWEIISSAHVGCDNPTETENFYRSLNPDWINTHLYREEHNGWVTEQRALADAQVAKKLGKAMVIGEFGAWYFANQSRKPELEGAVNRYNSWAAGYGFWGFNGVSASMNFSDNLGVSVHLPDYPDLAGLIHFYAQ